MARAQVSGRLTVDDWLQAGYALLTEEGVQALKIDNLCRRLGMTRGSFYWHFTDFKTYKNALLESWGSWQNANREELATLAGLPPRERLSALITHLISSRQWTLERTIREWARSDPEAMTSVRTSDAHLRRLLRAAFRDYGFDTKTAMRRAEWMLAIGVGALHLSDSPEAAHYSTAERAALVAFLLHQ